ncbi:hypothetical protein HMPREF1545_03049 [Oscillibacter sp. KLE 1728]|nr:hypothetical protein HMPREF1545_03049 [Oscillibacter sp. KLE 1728]ERK58591.1 hypothetical protein HMPREF1546_03656 [Oscillibacter sp. KLE 1745]
MGSRTEPEKRQILSGLNPCAIFHARAPRTGSFFALFPPGFSI